MEKESSPFLIVGLGNPGPEYDLTRHNIGFMIVDKIAEHNGVSMRKEGSLKGVIGRGKIGERDFFLLKPMTYMNNSGEAVSLTRRYYRVAMHQVLVISDEVALPFAKARLSEKGGAGGHRGLQNIEEMLGTQHYARLRIGIGDRKEGDLADFVLSRFTDEEQTNLSALIARAVKAVELWMNEGSEAARRALIPEKLNNKES